MQRRPLANEADRLYLTEQEYQLVLDEFVPALNAHYVRANDHERFRSGTRLMAESGFRSDDLDELLAGAFYVPFDDRVQITFARLFSSKASSGKYDDGKRRDPWIPQSLKGELQTHIDKRGLNEGTPVFAFSYSQLRDRIIVVGEHLADLTGNDDWLDLRPHDFRALFANRLAQQGVPDSVIMWLGGWADEETYRMKYKKPFLAYELQTALALADALDVEVAVPDEERPVEERVIDLLIEVQALLDELQ